MVIACYYDMTKRIRETIFLITYIIEIAFILSAFGKSCIFFKKIKQLYYITKKNVYFLFERINFSVIK